MARQKAGKSALTADIIAEADAAWKAEQDQQQAAYERFKTEECARQSVRDFCNATDALWFAINAAGESRSVFEPKPHLKSIHANLVKAVETLAAAGRLAEWEDSDPDATYSHFCQVDGIRVRTRPSYDCARTLFKRACKGQLTESQLVNTWERESLRDVIRWLRIFLCGLSGEHAVLPRKRQQDSQQPSLELREGGFILHTGQVHQSMSLPGKPLAVLRILADNRHHCRSWEDLNNEIWEGEGNEQNGKDAVSRLRAEIRKAHKKAGRGTLPFNPIRCAGKGKDLAWELVIPVIPMRV